MREKKTSLSKKREIHTEMSLEISEKTGINWHKMNIYWKKKWRPTTKLYVFTEHRNWDPKLNYI